MTKKISSVAEVISDKIVGNMIIAKYFCQRTVKLQNVWGIFIKYSVDNLQHHFQDTLGWQRGYFSLAWENGNSNAIQLLGSAVLNARYWLVKAAMVHILLLVHLQLWPKPCFWQSQYSWCLGLGCSCSWDGINSAAVVTAAFIQTVCQSTRGNTVSPPAPWTFPCSAVSGRSWNKAHVR